MSWGTITLIGGNEGDLGDLVVWLDKGLRFGVEPGQQWTSMNLFRVLAGFGVVNK